MTNHPTPEERVELTGENALTVEEADWLLRAAMDQGEFEGHRHPQQLPVAAKLRTALQAGKD